MATTANNNVKGCKGKDPMFYTDSAMHDKAKENKKRSALWKNRFMWLQRTCSFLFFDLKFDVPKIKKISMGIGRCQDDVPRSGGPPAPVGAPGPGPGPGHSGTASNKKNFLCEMESNSLTPPSLSRPFA